MTDPERETEQDGAVLVDLESEHHAAATVGLWEVGLHAAREAGAVTLLGAAGAELLGSDPVALKPGDRCLADLACGLGCVCEILGDRVRVEHNPETASAHGSSS